jgi:hypothetical protein
MAIRALLLTFFMAAVSLAGADSSPRGKLIQQAGQPSALETANHQVITLTGDAATQKVLHDARLAGLDFEAKGHFTSPTSFEVDPIENRALLVHKGDHVYRVTYYCDTCSIRTYEPGPCLCCQEETHLDLIDPKQDQ